MGYHVSRAKNLACTTSHRKSEAFRINKDQVTRTLRTFPTPFAMSRPQPKKEAVVLNVVYFQVLNWWKRATKTTTLRLWPRNPHHHCLCPRQLQVQHQRQRLFRRMSHPHRRLEAHWNPFWNRRLSKVSKYCVASMRLLKHMRIRRTCSDWLSYGLN